MTLTTWQSVIMTPRGEVESPATVVYERERETYDAIWGREVEAEVESDEVTARFYDDGTIELDAFGNELAVEAARRLCVYDEAAAGTHYTVTQVERLRDWVAARCDGLHCLGVVHAEGIWWVEIDPLLDRESAMVAVYEAMGEADDAY